MGRPARRFAGPVHPAPALALTALCLLAVVVLARCTGFSPVAISSPEVPENVPPTLSVLEPNEDLAISQGEDFIIRWTDSDPDNNAVIDIDLVQTDGLSVFAIAGGIFENDTTSDLFVVDTEDILVGTYFVRLTIDDGSNTPVVAFAIDPTTGNRVQVTVTEAGLGIQNLPPQVFVSEPQTNVGASQNDVISIVIRPTAMAPGPADPGPAFHYDRDDGTDVTILLDFDDDPTNDDFEAEEDPGNIILERRFIDEGTFVEIPFNIVINVQDIPVRQDGLPYFIRSSITDGLNTAHSYAAGRLHVLELVQGSAAADGQRRTVDLGLIGRTLAGARWLGFNPFANLGTKMVSALDQDNDGIDDFLLVAQFGNPRDLGNIGEAYLVYGRQLRFGGDININSVAPDFPVPSRNRVRGAVFHATTDSELPHVVDIAAGDDRRIGFQPLNEPYTLGITDAVAIGNLGSGDTFNNCALPELLISIPHSEYQGTTRDDDKGDDPDEDCGGPLLCYPDCLPNNYATDDFPDDPDLFTRYLEAPGDEFATEEKLGTVALFYGENNIAATDVEAADDGIPCNNNIAPPPRVVGLTACGSQQADDGQRHFGARFNVAIYDTVGEIVGTAPLCPGTIEPLNAHYGMTVGVLPDVDLNGLDEIIISAPRNEIESAALIAESGVLHPHIASRLSRGNITVFLGQDFRNLDARIDGTSHIPFIVGPQRTASGTCSPTPGGGCGTPRILEVEYHAEAAGDNATGSNVQPGWFLVRGEFPEDKLGRATTAGDFNLDGPADLLAGAPFADPMLDTDGNGFPDTTVQDAGKVYIVYLRFPFGNVELISASVDDAVLPRHPMLRIFGESPFDHLGLQQESGTDVNGDGISDVFIASKDYNGLGMEDNGFVGVVFGGQRLDDDRTVSQIATIELPGTRIYGSNDGDLFGADLSPSGDFNGDGLGDLLISAPGESVTLPGEDKPRNGVVYLIFGGRHLENKVFRTAQVGTAALPGVVFVGPYQLGTPDAFELDQPIFVNSQNCDPDSDGDGEIDDFECLCDPEVTEIPQDLENPQEGDCRLLRDASDGTLVLRRVDDAAPSRVGFVGDVNGDGFDDILIGNPTADFVDPALPALARRTDAGEAYLVYGNNFGANTININAP